MVFYRKYRPQTIEELDSKGVRDLLSSVLSSRDIAHAFLFTGPKGLGKTSAARIVAKAVNCLAKRDLASPDEKSKINPSTRRVPYGHPSSSGQKSKSQLKSQNLGNGKVDDQRLMTKDQVEPCNKCYQCTSITNGTNLDVLEIDGASNRGIDEIRDLREKVRLSPAASEKKVYIIDEVHMLTQEAFNALLKTLEEPPSHVIFILCTTEPHKVPATIVSRCFHVAFKKATTEELVRSFKRISEKERLKINNQALEFIASLSDGSFRDGVKILEEMAAYDKAITKELVQEKYQIRQLPDQISEMIGVLSKRDAKEGLQLVSKLVEQGVDIKYFIEQLVSELHQILLVEIGAIEKSKIIPTKSGQISKMSVEEIRQLVELVAKAHAGLKYAVLPQLPLELAIVEWGLQQPQNNAEPYAEQRGNKIQRSSASSSAYFSDKTKGAKELDGRTQVWRELIDKVKVYNHSIAGVLRGCRLKSYDNKEIVIETGYKFHKERLEDEKTRTIIEKVCKEISGIKIDVSVVLRE